MVYNYPGAADRIGILLDPVSGDEEAANRPITEKAAKDVSRKPEGNSCISEAFGTDVVVKVIEIYVVEEDRGSNGVEDLFDVFQVTALDVVSGKTDVLTKVIV